VNAFVFPGTVADDCTCSCIFEWVMRCRSDAIAEARTDDRAGDAENAGLEKAGGDWGE